MVPDPHTSCGPYIPADPRRYLQPLTAKENAQQIRPAATTDVHHDTIGIVALDVNGSVAGGTTTNGATFKIPGFVASNVLCAQHLPFFPIHFLHYFSL